MTLVDAVALIDAGVLIDAVALSWLPVAVAWLALGELRTPAARRARLAIGSVGVVLAMVFAWRVADIFWPIVVASGG